MNYDTNRGHVLCRYIGYDHTFHEVLVKLTFM